ncbi:Uma2 family endonuclease [Actinoalloteichus hymeniacidonis]|uniref:Putative restriction endonuclease domain-containing protein n=1 Tax=Actinoalloteichus hymeniacidonis TaxID=340345 RepID=A0AAC9MXV7_9PSEU|nr:Uma2 family endonuclease [Actinoalloteichus hymeniacidonis]AOS62774.1 hypothetical protein TL08_09795 [Actinoalloteichus hymeniacidonis]MBB5909195.1 Uma2 family endonuclease [Actinoalloteichus hymeniacidonis]
MVAPTETSTNIFAHAGPWTAAAVLELPEDHGQRIELVDGALVVSPVAGRTHQRILQRLQVSFLAAVPEEYESLPRISVLLDSGRLLIPDLAITNLPARDGLYLDAADLVLVVEVSSPASKMFDRALKKQLYAHAGIPFLLLVTPMAHSVTMTGFELIGGQYHETGRSRDGRLSLTRPFPVQLDLN